MKTLTNEQWDKVVPFGALATKQWLLQQGLSRHALDNALKSKKLRALTSGVYTRHALKPGWEGVVSSLQLMTEIPIHVGGLTALEIEGLSHYLSRSTFRTVHLYSPHPAPAWLSRLPENFRFDVHSTKKLWPDVLMEEKKFLKQHKNDLWPGFIYSCAEKAVLEVLMDVPKTVSFEHADELMRGLVNLSPRRLDVLLKACKNIKVKRLFFFLASRHHYAWLKKMTVADYDLGSGKRVVARNGRLDKQYQITVPEQLQRSELTYG